MCQLSQPQSDRKSCKVIRVGPSMVNVRPLFWRNKFTCLRLRCRLLSVFLCIEQYLYKCQITVHLYPLVIPLITLKHKNNLFYTKQRPTWFENGLYILILQLLCCHPYCPLNPWHKHFPGHMTHTHTKWLCEHRLTTFPLRGCAKWHFCRSNQWKNCRYYSFWVTIRFTA